MGQKLRSKRFNSAHRLMFISLALLLLLSLLGAFIMSRLKQGGNAATDPTSVTSPYAFNIGKSNMSSGLVASRQYPGIFWTFPERMQPSGINSNAEIYAVRYEGGQYRPLTTDAGTPVVKTFPVNMQGDGYWNWEDITIDSSNNIWLIDGAWGGRGYSQPLKAYKIPEPNPYVDTGATLQKVLYYKQPDPDSGRYVNDNEAAFSSAGNLYVVGKTWSPAIYKLDVTQVRNPSATQLNAGDVGVVTATKLGTVNYGSVSFYNKGNYMPILPTGADMSSDGCRLGLSHQGMRDAAAGTTIEADDNYKPRVIFKLSDADCSNTSLTADQRVTKLLTNGPGYVRYLPSTQQNLGEGETFAFGYGTYNVALAGGNTMMFWPQKYIETGTTNAMFIDTIRASSQQDATNDFKVAPTKSLYIYGSGFGTDIAAVSVSVGGMPATVQTLLGTYIKVAVPCLTAGVKADVSVTVSGVSSSTTGKPLEIIAGACGPTTTPTPNTPTPTPGTPTPTTTPPPGNLEWVKTNYPYAFVSTGVNGALGAAGTPVTLRGFNVTKNGFNFRDLTPPIAAQLYPELKRQGFNSIRLALDWSTMQPSNTTTLDATALAKVKSMVASAKAAGIMVVLDPLHVDGSESNVPAWITGKSSDHISMYRTNNQGLNYWKLIAEQFKDEPNVIAFDLMNEPGTTYDASAPGCSTTYINQDRIYAYEKELITALRAIDAEKPIMIANADGGSNITYADLTIFNGLTNIIATYHTYEDGTHATPFKTCGGAYYMPSSPCTAVPTNATVANLKNLIDIYLAKLDTVHIPSYLGEYGVCQIAGGLGPNWWVQSITSVLDGNNRLGVPISASYWEVLAGVSGINGYGSWAALDGNDYCVTTGTRPTPVYPNGNYCNQTAVRYTWFPWAYQLVNRTNPGDTTPPTVSITTPANGSSGSGSIAIAANASDNVAVSRVDILIDGAVKTSDSISPYTYDWVTTLADNGAHTIAAKAYDTAGNSATAQIAFTVNNSTPPVPTITSFTANPGSVIEQSFTTLQWSGTNISSCSITPGGPVNTTLFSWVTPPLGTVGTTTYTLTCKNATGATATKQVDIAVTAADPRIVAFTASASQVERGTSVSLLWQTTSTGGGCTLSGEGTVASNGTLTVTPSATTTYTLTCKNSSGKSTSSNTTVTVTDRPVLPDPTIVSFTAAPAQIKKGETSRLTWIASNADFCRLIGTSLDPTTAQNSLLVTLETSVSYRLVCVQSSTGKSVEATTSIKVDDIEPPKPPIDNGPGPGGSTGGGSNQDTSKNVVKPLQKKTIKVTDSKGNTTDVKNTAEDNTVEKGDQVVIDPFITLPNRARSITKVEYYIKGDLVQTDNTYPFALDTNQLKPGTYTITERVYFTDGFMQEQSRTIVVKPNTFSQKITHFFDSNLPILTVLLVLHLATVGLVPVFFALKARRWLPFMK